MPDFSKQVFVDTKSWSVGSLHHSLSFSSDGTTLAGTTVDNTPGYTNGRVQFWDAATGAPTSVADNWSFVTFSPVNPGIAAVTGFAGIQIMKWNSPGAKTWSVVGQPQPSFAHATAAFRSDGQKVTALQRNGTHLFQLDLNQFPNISDHFAPPTKPSSFAYCPSPSGLDTIVHGGLDGQIQVRSYSGSGSSTLLSTLSSTGSASISVCAWSQDGKYIAAGDNTGNVRFWNAGVTTNVSFARMLPTFKSGPITSLIFSSDSTVLIILSGGYLTVWDIAKAQYVSDSGLPTTAKNIALDGPRNRLAVVVDDRVALYELKLKEEPKKQPKKQTKKTPSIPPQLVPFDISDQVVKSKPDPFDGLYFKIYRGAWKLNTPRVFQHVVAIKALRPGFNPNSKAQDRQDFQNLLTKCIATWLDLTHDNLVPLLGVSMNFDNFPAMVTSWMINGLLSDYIKLNEEYDKMELVIGVASGVEYLHSKNIVHSDIQASSVLVDELGNPRLADPGFLSVLANSPLIKGGLMNVPYRWMAPELIKNSSQKATFATDVYSVTMTSLEIFTASPPFEGVNDALVSGQIVQDQRPSRPDGVEDGLWGLWGEGWNSDPTKRPNMANYVQRLKQWE